MENGNAANRSAPARPGQRLVLRFLLSIFCASIALALSGCAAPAPPSPPHPPIAEAVTDLAAHQSGNSISLTFTPPIKTVNGEPLDSPPQIEIYREFLPAGATSAPGATPKGLIYTIPGELVDTYASEGRVRFLDPLKPEELARHAGEQAVYMVRTRTSKRKQSADSNAATVRVYPVAEPVGGVNLIVTQEGIELRWAPPERTATGQAVRVVNYRVYRAEVAPGAEAEAAQNPAKAKLAAPPALLGVTPSASYRDTQFEFGRTYVYTVRSVVQYGADSVESADSLPAVLTPRDTFPPAAPKDLVVVPVLATPAEPAHLELSWAISPEPDLAGYNVYRSDQEGVPGQKLNRELLLTPTFRDMGVVAGRRYFYTVTSVDRAGNESSPSAAVSAVVPNERRMP